MLQAAFNYAAPSLPVLVLVLGLNYIAQTLVTGFAPPAKDASEAAKVAVKAVAAAAGPALVDKPFAQAIGTQAGVGAEAATKFGAILGISGICCALIVSLIRPRS